jgi:hypothetical protein
MGGVIVLLFLNLFVAVSAQATPVIVAQCENVKQHVTLDLGSQVSAGETGYALDVNYPRTVGTLLGVGRLVSGQNGVFVFNLKASLALMRFDGGAGRQRPLTIPSTYITSGFTESRVTVDVNHKTALLQLGSSVTINLTCSYASGG